MKSEKSLRKKKRCRKFQRVTHVANRVRSRYGIDIRPKDISIHIPNLISMGVAREASYTDVSKESRQQCCGYYLVDYGNSELVVILDLLTNEIKTILPSNSHQIQCLGDYFSDIRC